MCYNEVISLDLRHIYLPCLQSPLEEKEEEAPPEEDYDEDDLPRIQEQVNALQAEFDQSVVEKHSLEMELISMNERLKAATEMVER